MAVLWKRGTFCPKQNQCIRKVALFSIELGPICCRRSRRLFSALYAGYCMCHEIIVTLSVVLLCNTPCALYIVQRKWQIEQVGPGSLPERVQISQTKQKRALTFVFILEISTILILLFTVLIERTFSRSFENVELNGILYSSTSINGCMIAGPRS